MASQESAYAVLKHTLTSWGLGSLYQHAVQFLQRGYSSDEVQLKLEDTKEYQTRFAGNELRKKAGLSTLSPAEYIALEEQYHQTMRNYGLPKGFYDDKGATDSWIGGDVSPTELASRAQAASDLVIGSPKSALDTFNHFYGTSGQGAAIAAILDPTKAAPLLQQQVLASQIGGSAVDQGLSTSRSRAEQFAKFGVTLAQARQAYSDIAARASTDRTAGARFGTNLTQTDEENVALLGDAKAAQKQSLVYGEEAAQFGGHGAASDQSNSAGSNY